MIERGLLASGCLFLAVGLALMPGSIRAQETAAESTVWITAERMLDVRSGRLIDNPPCAGTRRPHR